MLEAVRGAGADNLRPLVLLAIAIAILTLGARQAQAAEPSCEARQMNIVAHQDDDLLFQSPDLLEAVADGDCVRTVYVTAGDAGLGEAYWREREAGSRAGYAEMAESADLWTTSEPTVAGHPLHLQTLVGVPRISQVYLRLPNGGPAGAGYAATGFQSLPKLWRSQHPEPAGLEPISSITAVDDSTTYTYEGLLSTLEALIEEFQPDVIAIQNSTVEFGSGDHFDHIVVARLAQVAAASYGAEHLLTAYQDYETASRSANVFEPQLAAKLNAYFAYAVHDSNEACSSQVSCEEPPYATSYWAWLHRQYVAAQSSVPGADPGAAQSVASGAQVTLDGSGSSDPLGHALSYEWQQLSGPAVTLSDPTAVKPTFTAPTGPATLVFSLRVTSPEASSVPVPVSVTVAAVPAEPIPPPPPPPPAEPPEPAERPEIRPTTVELVAGRPSRQVISVAGTPWPEVSATARLPAGVTYRVRRDGQVVIRSTGGAISAGFYRAHVVASNSAGTTHSPVLVIVRPDPRAPVRVDLAVPAA